MFMLYALVAGLALGVALGGDPRRMSLPFRWPWLAVAGLLGQVVLFSPAVTAAIGGIGPILYVASTMVVLAVVLANVRGMPGLALVVAGGVANLAAILANGGYMPSVPEAALAAGRALADGYSNSVETASPALPALVDRFAIPAGLPFANVFSVGDVLIAVGIVAVIALAMRPDRSGAEAGVTPVGRAPTEAAG